jgi:pimeloyl-ACP methyl ester carboxylesterase
MKDTFPTGTYQFHDEPNFNYQMNRWTSLGNLPVDVVSKTAAKIKNLQDYCSEFLKLAGEAEANGDIKRAAFYYRAVDFFLPYDDPGKEKIYDKAVSLMREHHCGYFKEKRIRESHVPYGTGYLPAWHVPSETAESKGSILFTGGFDCLKEELVPVLIYFSDAGYNIYYFEGPGQGETLAKEKIAMTHEWEQPVAAVLDHFNLDDVSIIGLSLGGYLAPRAAISEKRIKRVVLWGIMYDFFDVVTSRRGRLLELFLRTMLFLKLSFIINLMVRMVMRKDAYTHWGVDHGMHVLGARTPAEYFSKLRSYSLKTLAESIRQDVLLMSGSEDHFVPISHFYVLMKKMKNARSITGRVFTTHESGENHCQFGNIGLALDFIANWIELTKNRT